MDPIAGLSLGRVAIGTLALTRPTDAARLFGLDVEADRQLGFMTRMFASREIVVGAATLLARGPLRERLALAGVAIDAADGYAGWVGGRDGSLSRRAATMMTAVPAGAVVAGVVSVVGERRRRRTATRAERLAARLGG